MLRSRLMLLACTLVPVTALAAPTNQVHALRQQVAAIQSGSLRATGAIGGMLTTITAIRTRFATDTLKMDQ